MLYAGRFWWTRKPFSRAARECGGIEVTPEVAGQPCGVNDMSKSTRRRPRARQPSVSGVSSATKNDIESTPARTPTAFGGSSEPPPRGSRYDCCAEPTLDCTETCDDSQNRMELPAAERG